eukprot:31130_1
MSPFEIYQLNKSARNQFYREAMSRNHRNLLGAGSQMGDLPMNLNFAFAAMPSAFISSKITVKCVSSDGSVNNPMCANCLKAASLIGPISQRHVLHIMLGSKTMYAEQVLGDGSSIDSVSVEVLINSLTNGESYHDCFNNGSHCCYRKSTSFTRDAPGFLLINIHDGKLAERAERVLDFNGKRMSLVYTGNYQSLPFRHWWGYFMLRNQWFKYDDVANGGNMVPARPRNVTSQNTIILLYATDDMLQAVSGEPLSTTALPTSAALNSSDSF